MTDKRGIGGWLLVFILWLALVSALNLLVGLRQTGYRRSAMGAFGVLGVVTIVQLVRKQSSGIPLAKTALAFAIMMLMLQIARLKTSQQGSRLGGNIIICGSWFAYLLKSERVKNTFGPT
jgi:surface polysaccharide O-acyltransferase-like enzyme